MRKLGLLLLCVWLVVGTACGDDAGGSARGDSGTHQHADAGHEHEQDAATGNPQTDAATSSNDDAATGTGTDAALADAASGGGDCANELKVEVDGTPRTGCMAEFHMGGLNHVIAVLDDGTQMIVNFNGQVAADDVCVGFGMRKPGNETTMNDWMVVGDCTVDIRLYDVDGKHAVGTFSGTVSPVTGGGADVVLTNGSFDVTHE